MPATCLHSSYHYHASYRDTRRPPPNFQHGARWDSPLFRGRLCGQARPRPLIEQVCLPHQFWPARLRMTNIVRPIQVPSKLQIVPNPPRALLDLAVASTSQLSNRRPLCLCTRFRALVFRPVASLLLIPEPTRLLRTNTIRILRESFMYPVALQHTPTACRSLPSNLTRPSIVATLRGSRCVVHRFVVSETYQDKVFVFVSSGFVQSSVSQ
ncbi:hypothetical protein K438DRAFT_234873 [Mycena galopus ATCC 62051]|nr:hypothetical protein K438DRAFT_234873 [Mycena galopus ATCC 62051]